MIPDAEFNFSTTGGDRAVSVDQTLARLKPLLRPDMIRGLKYLTPYGQDWCHVAITTLAVPGYEGDSVRILGAAGKGGTAREAIVSALAESVERLSFRQRPFDVVKRSSFESLGGARALTPPELDGFSEAQLARGPRTEGDVSEWLPSRWDPGAQIEWTRAWSMTRDEFVLIPAQQVFFRHPLAHSFCRAHSNGLSAGNTVGECVLQGFLELVERDAMAIWWYNDLQRPEVDVSSAASPLLREAKSRYQTLGRELVFLDLTHDLGVPVIAAATWRPGQANEKVAFCAGAHFDPEIAAKRAVTELGQWLCNYDNAERGLPVQMDLLAHSLFEGSRRDGFRALVPKGRVGLGPRPVRSGLKAVADVVETRGLELIAVHLTRPEYDFPVVKVIVPELAMHWPRFGKRRLYDVPVKLGWLERAKTEAELNPLHLS